MEKERLTPPDYLFEVSWEVCNKVGGINTVIATKAKSMSAIMKDRYVLIGPNLNISDEVSGFVEDKSVGYVAEILSLANIEARVGRWNVEGSPMVVLIDFTKYFPKSNDILRKLWENYKIDSLNSSWDYIEPVVFGYAAGRVIRALASSLTAKFPNIVAHFHEWMTATGGFYLKEALPEVYTVFTTHATILGRSIAGNRWGLYSNLDNINPAHKASELGITPKFSMERAAANYFDAFATVSDVTANECSKLLGVVPSMVTPNGFENDFVWKGEEFTKKREAAREKLRSIAEAVVGRKFESEPFYVGTSGRYEFYNKGLDLFIESLNRLANSRKVDRDIVAFVTVPAGHNGPRQDLLAKMQNPEVALDSNMLPNVTHYLSDYYNDPIINALQDSPILSSDKVHLIFVPCYIDLNDGLFNCDYYEMLVGLDMSAYASYYEPWGYTPMESIAYGVPTVTTNLAGFGMWVNERTTDNDSVTVIERNDHNSDYVSREISQRILELSQLDSSAFEQLRASAMRLSEEFKWDKLVVYYQELYSNILNKGRVIVSSANFEQLSNVPTWRRILIDRRVPERIEKIEVLAKNLWWAWAVDGDRLFKSIDLELWRSCGKNPYAFLDILGYARLKELSTNEEFLEKLDSLYNQFEEYMNIPEDTTRPKIAYFSMEYGLVNYLKIYSGGLGILAGDYLKEASDNNNPMVAVGLLYRYGYFTQKISASGEQEATYEIQDFGKLPLTAVTNESGNLVLIKMNILGRDVYARVWRCDVGRIKLFLLDTDFEMNSDEDRTITHYLYGGDWENRLKQEIVLGIGGIRALKAMGIEQEVYHCNEGHAAFIGLERIRNLINDKQLSFDEALEYVRCSSLFTTHTPVPAGHDAFSEELIRNYLFAYSMDLKIEWSRFLRLGKTNIFDPNEKFSMSVLACSLSQEVNGVSWLHGEVSKDILGYQWPGYFKNELHISYVTNGVHLPTWASVQLRKIYAENFDANLDKNEYNKAKWENIYNVPDETIWSKRLILKERLVDHMKDCISDPARYRSQSPRDMITVREQLKADVLTIGFARRFATYKRAHLLFDNLERLSGIVNNPNRPVQFVFAGKAHPNDKPGQDLIKHIIEVSRMPQFKGKIIFLENYDMNLARKMIKGVDVWLNTPQRPLEASGTSGEKAAMNGVMHFSVLDGWWVEGYRKGAGWALPLEATFEDDRRQNEVDSEMIYNIIEEEIAPLYYSRNENNIPTDWVASIKKCIAEVASNFNTHRMLTDYEDRFYNPLQERTKFMYANNLENIKALASWKSHTIEAWDSMSLDRVVRYDNIKPGRKIGEDFVTEVYLDLGQLKPQDVGIELVVSKQIINSQVEILNKTQFEYIGTEGNIAKYELHYPMPNTGTFDTAIRVYANNPLLAHRMDCALVKWI